MHRYFFTTKDAFINSGSDSITGEDYTDKNTGQDEVLELKKVFFNRDFSYNTRVLVQFDVDEIENYISSSVLSTTTDYKTNLRLWETKGTSGLSETYTIAAYPLSESWSEGVGKEGDVPKTTDGVSWKNRQYPAGGSEVNWTTAGGTYISGDEVTQSFSAESPDLNINITSIAKKWFSGENNNYGLLLRLSGSREQSTGSYE